MLRSLVGSEMCIRDRVWWGQIRSTEGVLARGNLWQSQTCPAHICIPLGVALTLADGDRLAIDFFDASAIGSGLTILSDGSGCGGVSCVIRGNFGRLGGGLGSTGITITANEIRMSSDIPFIPKAVDETVTIRDDSGRVVAQSTGWVLSTDRSSAVLSAQVDGMLLAASANRPLYIQFSSNSIEIVAKRVPGGLIVGQMLAMVAGLIGTLFVTRNATMDIAFKVGMGFAVGAGVGLALVVIGIAFPWFIGAFVILSALSCAAGAALRRWNP